jgi:hypothetical protein
LNIEKTGGSVTSKTKRGLNKRKASASIMLRLFCVFREYVMKTKLLGLPQEFGGTRILGRFLEDYEFGPGRGHTPSLQQQIAGVLVATARGIAVT